MCNMSKKEKGKVGEDRLTLYASSHAETHTNHHVCTLA